MSPRRLRTVLLLVPALAAAWGPGAVRAATQAPQWGANVGARVTVAPPPILLETTRDLYFGSVGAGMVVDVPAEPPYAAGTWSAAARFGNLRKTVTYGVTFTLPSQLVNGSGATIPISFDGTEYGWMCAWNTSSGTPGVCAVQEADFNPTSHTATPLVIDFPNNTPGNNNFAADLYLGGRLSVPSGAVAPGLYSAPISITLARVN